MLGGGVPAQGEALPRLRVPRHRPQEVHGSHRQGPERHPGSHGHCQEAHVPPSQGHHPLPPARKQRCISGPCR